MNFINKPSSRTQSQLQMNQRREKSRGEECKCCKDLKSPCTSPQVLCSLTWEHVRRLILSWLHFWINFYLETPKKFSEVIWFPEFVHGQVFQNKCSRVKVLDDISSETLLISFNNNKNLKIIWELIHLSHVKRNIFRYLTFFNNLAWCKNRIQAKLGVWNHQNQTVPIPLCCKAMIY